MGLGLAAACGGDPEPVFSAPEIADVTVTAEAQSAVISFRVINGEANHCGVNLSEETPGAAVFRVEGSLNEGVAEVKPAKLTAGTAYRFTPWADNGKFEIKGEEQTFTTDTLPDVRIYDFFCSSPSSSSISVSFRYTAPERVLSACLWCWPADGTGIHDPDARKVPVKASATGDITLTVYGLSEGTTYNAQPFIYTEEGEIAGHIQQFQTIISNVSITWESPVSFQDDRPYVVVMEVGVKNHAYLGSLGIYYLIQEGDHISFDENSMVIGPQKLVPDDELVRLSYLFAKSETRYTVLPFARAGGHEEFLGTPLSFTTGKDTLTSFSELGELHYPDMNGGAYGSSGNIIWTLKSHVPDPIFRQYLLDQFDTNHDGDLNCNEANSVRYIDCRNMGISSLRGIERFQNAVSINCSGNPVSEIYLGFHASFSEARWCPSWWCPALKEFIALDMNDSKGNNVLKKVDIGESCARVEVPESCFVYYHQGGY